MFHPVGPKSESLLHRQCPEDDKERTAPWRWCGRGTALGSQGSVGADCITAVVGRC